MERLRSALVRGHTVAPMASLAFACLAGTASTHSWWWAGGLIAVAFLVARPGWRWWVAVVLLALTVAWRAELLDAPARESLAQPRSELVEGIIEVGRPAGNERERFGILRQGDQSRSVLILNAVDYRAGEIWKIRGRFFVPGRERNPGVFPRVAQWRRWSLSGAVVIRERERVEVDWLSAPLRWAENLRAGLSVSITRGLSDESNGRQVIEAMVLGDKPPRNSEVSRAFRESGAMHVFAVSGLHVTLMGVITWLLLRPFPIQRRTGLLIVMMVMAWYAMVTGLRPPAVRATVMAVCFIGAFFLRRRPSLFNALSFSLVLVLLWRPSQVFEAGFQLSYGVLLAIGIGVIWTIKLTGRIAELDPFFPARLLSDGQRRVWKTRRYFANLGASSLAAWVGSMPVMIWHFGVVTPVAALTSMVLIPATMVILWLAFVAAIVGLFIPTAGSGVNWLNEKVAAGAFHAAKGFSQIPGAHWSSRRMMPADWVIFDPEDGGSASLLDAGEGVMIETGSELFFRRQLRGILNRWNAFPGMVLVTHPDGDHAGGLPALLERGGLSQAILPIDNALSPTYREFLRNANADRCKVLFGQEGEVIELDDEVKVEILRVPGREFSGIADHRMMVMKVHWKEWKVLVAGDLGMRDELALIDSGVDLSADVVWMGWHDWGVSGQHQFLEATGAKIVIVSASGVPASKRPKESWFEHREERYHLFRQSETGAVMLDFDDDELRVTSYLNPEKKVTLQR